MSLGRSELFSFVNTSANLLGDDWQGNSSSRKIYTSLLARLTSTYYCFVLQGVFQHLGYCLWWILSCFWSGNSLEVSASFLRVILSFSVQRFPEKALKLSEKFMIVLPTFSKKGLRRCWCTFWLYPHNLDLSVPSYLLGGYPLLSLDCLIIWLLVWRLLFGGIMLVPQFSVMTGVTKVLEGLLCSILGSFIPDSPPLI